MKRLLLLSLTLLLTLPALSQAPKYAPDSDAWWRNVSKQMHVILNSPIPAVRAQALKNSIYYATYHPDRISMDGSVRQIIKLHQRDGDPYVRRLAVAALEAIGDARAKNYLSDTVSPVEARESHQLIVDVLNEMEAGLSRSSL